MLTDLDIKESVIAGDSTGYTLSTASAYYRTRRGQPFRGWLKGSYTVGTHSQMILVAQTSRRVSPSDAHMLEPLRNSAQVYAQGAEWLFLADAGFDCQAVTERDLIPPIRRGGRLVASNAKPALT